MEDSHIANLNIFGEKSMNVFGVFDGHGGIYNIIKGKEVAQFVKNHFTKELQNNNNLKNGNVELALLENFLKMDTLLNEPTGKAELRLEAKKSKLEEEKNNIFQEANKQMDLFKNMFDPRNMEDCDIAMFTGCTACVCVICEDMVYFANAGDSRAIICKNGIAYEMTTDHKPDLETEKSRIYKAEGWVSQGRVKGNLNLSRSIGDLEYKQNPKLLPEYQMITAYPEIKKEGIKDIDFIVIACDGVWDCKKNQEVADFIYDRLKKGVKKLSTIIEELFEEILATDIYNGNNN